MNSSTILYGLLLLAACLLLRDKIPYIGRLPGDFDFAWKNLRFFAPITSMLLLSFIIALLRGFFKQ